LCNGDSITSTQTNPTHVYINTGTYTVPLTAISAFGISHVTGVFVVEYGMIEIYLP
jgi:PKD repeat protein